jgi:starch phosphorylase
MSEEVRTREETRTLYELLQDQVVPLYYAHGKMGFSPGWIRMAKRSMATIMPRFNSKRMVGEYLAKCYLPASRQHRLYKQNQYDNSHVIAAWKARIRHAWPGVELRRIDVGQLEIKFGESLHFEVGVNLNGLRSSDVIVEMLMGFSSYGKPLRNPHRYKLEATSTSSDAGEVIFAADVKPEHCGKLEYHIRVYPFHDMLTHPFELGMMRWL